MSRLPIMSLLGLARARTTLRSTVSLWLVRGYASTSSTEPTSSQPPKPASSESTKSVASSCPAGTVLTGLNYLKGEPPLVAQPDETYPSWLWDLTKPKVDADDGPGGRVEKRRLRLAHRQTLKDSNLFKAK